MSRSVESHPTLSITGRTEAKTDVCTACFLAPLLKPATETPKSPTPPPAAPKIPTGPAADAAAALAVQQQQEAMYQHHVATYGDPQVIQHNIQQNMMMLTNPALRQSTWL